MKKKLVPATPSSAIPETGFVLMSNILGSPELEIPPIFKVSRPTLYAAIRDGRLPHPVKIGTARKARNAWPSIVIKNLVARLEEQGASTLSPTVEAL